MTSWIVVSDLDGTLLDHASYDFEPAREALDVLVERQIPLVLATSKTQAEVALLRRQLGVPGASIVENGGSIVIDSAVRDPVSGASTSAGDGVESIQLGPEYAHIVQRLAQLRREFSLDFAGFSDMSDEDVAKETGLDLPAARRARDRMSSEPIVWRDSEEALERFVRALDAQGFELTRGGRFFHVLGRVSKASALRVLLEAAISKRPPSEPQECQQILALGDSPNDCELLEMADVAVVVPNPAARSPLQPREGWRLASAPGPTGWNEAVLDVVGGSQ